MYYQKRKRTRAIALVFLASVLCATVLLLAAFINISRVALTGSYSAAPTKVARIPARPTLAGSTATPRHRVQPTRALPTEAPIMGPPPYIPTIEPAISEGTPVGLPAPASGTLQVHFISVGQGDSVLILAPGGLAMLIDGGYPGMGTVEYLQAYGVKRIALMVATHPHADHIGGLVDVLHAIPVDEVVTNGRPYTTQVYEQFIDAIASAKASYREVKRGDELTLGNLTFQVLSPGSNSSNEDINDSSIVLRLMYGPTSFLFTGDAESSAEREMVASGLPLQSDILKVGHHGSHTSSTPEFLRAVKPKVAIYSAGVNNPYGHPHRSPLEALARVGAQVYGTDVNGTVVVTADNRGYSIYTAKSAGPRAPPTYTPPTHSVVPTKTQRALPHATPYATPHPTQTIAPFGQVGIDLPLEVLSLSSPARRNSLATLSIKTVPGAYCEITVMYKSGPSRARGLDPQVADAEGVVSWTWQVGGNTTPGTWRIIVSANAEGRSSTRQIPFEVIR